MTHPETWEAVCRETLYRVLVCLAADVEETTRPVADTVYWGGDPDREQVERLRRLSFEFEYAVEAYVAALCDSTEPWGGDAPVPWRAVYADAIDCGDGGDGGGDENGDDDDSDTGGGDTDHGGNGNGNDGESATDDETTTGEDAGDAADDEPGDERSEA